MVSIEKFVFDVTMISREIFQFEIVHRRNLILSRLSYMNKNLMFHSVIYQLQSTVCPFFFPYRIIKVKKKKKKHINGIV